MTAQKPLGRKAYGSIGHLPASRSGSGEHCVHEGQARICTERARDRHDVITVTEKLDGTNVAVAHVDGRIRALIRAGWPAESAPREMHRLFARWVADSDRKFRGMLVEGECVHGEWLAQAHGTLYDIDEVHPPFVAFDLTRTDEPGGARIRIPHADAERRCWLHGIVTARVLSSGPPVSVAAARELLETDRSCHGVRSGRSDGRRGVARRAAWAVRLHGQVGRPGEGRRPVSAGAVGEAGRMAVETLVFC